MYCQACATKNTEDSRFCKHCGAPIARPGMSGGPIPGATLFGAGRPRDPRVASPEGSEDAGPGGAAAEPAEGAATIKDSQPAGAGAEGPELADPARAPAGPSAEKTVKGHPVARAPGAAAGEPARSGDAAPSPTRREPLRPPSGQMSGEGSMVASMSIQLSEIGVRSPRKLLVATVSACVLLFGLGAGLTYLLVERAAPAAAPDGSGEQALVIGMPVPGPTEPGLPAAPEPDAALPDGGPERDEATGQGGVPTKAVGPDGVRPARPRAPEPAAPADSPARRPEAGGAEPSGSPEPSVPAAGRTSPDPGGAPPPFDDEMEERDPAVSAYAGQVRYVIQRFYSARAQACFERASRERAEPLFGTVVVRFQVGEDGQVRSASAVRNTTGSRDLQSCLEGQVRSWRLPAPPAGQVTMEMPFSQ